LNLTANEFMEKFNISRVTLYNYINTHRVKSFKEGNSRVIVIDDDAETLSDVLLPNSTSIYNSQSDSEKNEDNISYFKDEIDRLHNIIEQKDEEIRKLNELIRNDRKIQKDEIIELQKNKDNQLKIFMELVEKQVDNVLPKNSSSPIVEQIIEPKLVTQPKFIGLKTFLKKLDIPKTQKELLKEKYTEMAIKNKKSDGLLIRDGKVYIIEDFDIKL
jgi:predicted site-specific integrase-resolvase